MFFDIGLTDTVWQFELHRVTFYAALQFDRCCRKCTDSEILAIRAAMPDHVTAACPHVDAGTYYPGAVFDRAGIPRSREITYTCRRMAF